MTDRPVIPARNAGSAYVGRGGVSSNPIVFPEETPTGQSLTEMFAKRTGSYRSRGTEAGIDNAIKARLEDGVSKLRAYIEEQGEGFSFANIDWDEEKHGPLSLFIVRNAGIEGFKLFKQHGGVWESKHKDGIINMMRDQMSWAAEEPIQDMFPETKSLFPKAEAGDPKREL